MVAVHQQNSFLATECHHSEWLFNVFFCRLKEGWGAQLQAMGISYDVLPNGIFALFVLHNYCEVHGETLSKEKLKESCSYEREFQPLTFIPGYGAAFSETSEKHIRQIFAKFFH